LRRDGWPFFSRRFGGGPTNIVVPVALPVARPFPVVPRSSTPPWSHRSSALSWLIGTTAAGGHFVAVEVGEEAVTEKTAKEESKNWGPYVSDVDS